MLKSPCLREVVMISLLRSQPNYLLRAILSRPHIFIHIKFLSHNQGTLLLHLRVILVSLGFQILKTCNGLEVLIFVIHSK